MRALLAAVGLLAAGCDTGRSPSNDNSVFRVGLLRVQDEAELLSGAQELELIRLSESLEKATTDQLVIVTVRTLGGKDIASFSTSLGNRLGVGQADKDNGVLIVVAPNERKVRISVGYGLEGLLTDQRSAAIIRQMLPRFAAGEHDRAIALGAAEIAEVLRSDLERPQYLKKAA